MPSLRDCIHEQIEAARDHERSEQDLDAQQTMAQFTRLMGWTAVAGLVLGGVSIVVIYRTLREMVTTNQIMQDQQRPWLQFEANTGGAISTGTAEIFIYLINRGTSPARDVEVNVHQGEGVFTHLESSGQSISLASVVFPNDPALGMRHFLRVNGSGPWFISCSARYSLPSGRIGFTFTHFNASRNGKIVEIKEAPGGQTT